MYEYYKLVGISLLFFLFSCAGDSGGSGIYGLKEGSKPINDAEELQYKKALIRCHKTGGSRIVKIKGKLRCF
ncbi:MAG: hypothetical protein AB8G05_14210 [Oligoflexales bacterium]